MALLEEPQHLAPILPAGTRMEPESLHVLLVDDDPNLLATMGDILKVKGFEPIPVRTAVAALAQTGDIDVALIDLHLEDMPGLELLSRIKTKFPGSECILLTGHASQGSAIEAINAGAFSYFQKPCDIDQLVLSIQRAGEKRAAGHALRESEERFRSLYENSPVGIYRTTPDGRILMANPFLLRMLGFDSFEQLAQRNLDQAGYEPGYPRSQFLSAMEKDGEVHGMESAWLTRRGESILVRESAQVVRDAQGQILFFDGTVEDITASKQAEATLRESEDRYRGAITSAGLVPYEIDYKQGRFTFIGEDILKLTGYPAGEFTPAILKASVLESHVWGLENTGILPDEAPGRFMAGEIGKWGNDLRIRTLSGEERWISDVSVPLPDEHGRVTGAIGIFQDLTQRKQAEERLGQAEARLRALVEQVPAIVYTESAETRETIYISPQIERLTGHSPAEWLGNRDAWKALIHPDDYPAVMAEDNRTSATGEPFRWEYRVLTRDGRCVWFRDEAVLIKSQDGTPLFWQGSISDISDRKQAEVDLLASRAAEMNFAERLAILSEVTTELSKADSMDALCRRAVELGREKLDFDRLSIWMSAEGHATMLGTFGVDTEGHFTDERGLQIPIESDFVSMPVLQGHVPLLLRKDVPLTLKGQVVGQGMHVSAGLWDGKSIIGYLAIDNLLDQQPISDRDCEIIRLYASALGQLISLKRAEQAVRTSEERYRTLADNMTDTIWLMDLDLKTTYISPSVIKQRGYTLEELNTVPLDRQMTAESFARIVKMFTSELAPVRLAQTGVPIAATLELELFRKDGSTFWSGNSYSLIRDPLGQPLAILGSGRDITESKKARMDLESSEKRFRAMIEHNTDAVVLVDPRGRVLFESPAYGRMTGRDTRDRIGRSSFEFVHPDDLPGVSRVFYELVQSPGRIAHATFRNRHKDGSWRWIEATATNLLWESAIQAIIINMKDITERKQAEENLRQRVSELEVLYETSSSISRMLEPKEIGRKVIDVLSEKLSWRQAFIRLYHPETQSLELLVFNRPGLTEQQLQTETRRLNRIIAKPGQGVSGWVIQHGQAIRSGDINSDPRSIITFKDTRSGLYVPMQVGQRILGVIGVESELPAAYTEADERLLTTLAAQAGIALENARLLAETLQQVEEMSALADCSAALRTAMTRSEIISVILDQLGQGLFPTDDACLVTYDPRTGGNIIEAARGKWKKWVGTCLQPGEGLGGLVAETRQPFQSNDLLQEPRASQRIKIRQMEAAAGVPLLVQGQFLGSLWVGRTRRQKGKPPIPLTSDEMRLLGSVADMAANALQRTSLYEQTLRHAGELLTINTMGRLLAETLDLGQIYTKLDELVRQLLDDISQVAISLYNPDKALVTYVWLKNDGVKMDTSALPPAPVEPPGQGTRSEAIHTRQPVIINNLGEQVEKIDIKMDPGTDDGRFPQSGLYAPMLVHGRVTGVLQVQSYSLNRFSQSEADLLSLVANTAAVDIENARLLSETQKTLHNLAALHEIDIAISASVDIHVTLDILLEQTVSELNVDAAAVLLLNPLTRTLEYAASQGFRKHQVAGRQIPLGTGLAGQAALQRQIQSIPDLREAPRQENQKTAIDIYGGEGFVAHYAIPLSAKGQVQGVLEVFQRSPFQPDVEWFTFLETLSRQAAIAIDNNNLFENLQRSNTNIILAYDATIQGWSQALELRDKETEGHARRVTERTMQLAQLVGVPLAEMEHVRRGTLLHDIGKMGIPDAILLKPGKLTEAEWVIMRRHPVFAYEMLSSIAYLRPALDIPHYHHEKWDGTGYPDGLKGEQIPLYARVFAIVDVYDALTNDRPYRPAWTTAQALEYIRTESGRHFDPAIVDVFLDMLAREK